MKDAKVTSLPRRPACETNQKSPLQRGLATLLFATQPAGKFFVLPPKSLIFKFSTKLSLIWYSLTGCPQEKT
jgi:hypothetical protein